MALVAPDSTAMKLWFGQMVLNWLWSPVFFAFRQPVPALVIILAILAVIGLFVRTAWRLDRPAALLFLPYAAWVAFATLLNASIVALN